MVNTWSQWISNPIVNLSVLLVRIHIELMIHHLKNKTKNKYLDRWSGSIF